MSEREEVLTLNEQRMTEIRARHVKANGPWWYSTTIPEAEHNVCIKHEHTDVYRTTLETHEVESKPGMFWAKLETRQVNVACVLSDNAADVAVMANAYQDIAMLFAVIGDRDNEIAALRSQLAAVTAALKATEEEASSVMDDWKVAVGLLDEVRDLAHEQTERADTAERERDEARRALRVIADANVSYEAGTANYLDMAHQTVATVKRLRHRAERAELVVEAAKEWLADLWRGDMNGTVIGVCMEYEPDGQYALWEQVAPIAEAVRALDAAEGKA